MAKKRKPTPKPEPSSSEEEEVEEEEEDDDDDDDEVEVEDEDEEDEDLSSRDSIRKLLEPFGKDQLIELLKDAVLKNPALISRISATDSNSNSDPAERKIFVHGLSWDSTTETLTAAFARYGEIEESRAVADRTTGRCKGFGFVLFRTAAAARKALKEPQKKIGNRMASCQLASLGPQASQPVADPAARKIFVSGIGEHVSPERLRAFFAKFGEIEEGPLGCDPITGRLLRFAIFVYRTVEGCKRSLEEPIKFFEGCELHCKGEAGGTKMQPFGIPDGLQPYDLALTSPAMMSRSPAGFVRQNAGFGMLNPVADTSRLPPSFNTSGTTPPYGVGLGFGGGSSGVNSISSSVISRYGSPSALYGLGPLGTYQSSPPASAMRYESDVGYGYSRTGLPPYYGRY